MGKRRIQKQRFREVYKCRICGVFTPMRYQMAKHMSDFHTHLSTSPTPTSNSEKRSPASSSAVLKNPLDEWKFKDATPAPFERVQLPELKIVLTPCFESTSSETPQNTYSPMARPRRSTAAAKYRLEDSIITQLISKETTSHSKGTRAITPKCLKAKPGNKSRILHTCHTCKKKFATKTNLKYHVRVHKNAKPFVCKICSKAYRAPTLLRYHMLEHADHSDIKSDPNLADCLERKKELNERRRLRMKIYKPELKLQCPHCPKRFPYISQLNHHITAHSKSHPHVCEVCGSKYKHLYTLNQHKVLGKCEAVLEALSTKKFPCPHCQIFVKSPKYLQTHLKRFHGVQKQQISEEAYNCLFCDYKAFTAYNLARHNRSHTGEKPFTCVACKKTFSLRPNMYQHMRNCPDALRLGLKPVPIRPPRPTHNNKSNKEGNPDFEVFKCSFCDQRFSCRYKVRCHERSHGDKYDCPFCPAKFAHPIGLGLHKTRAHGDKIEGFTCDQCGMNFKTPTGFTAHRRSTGHKVGKKLPTKIQYKKSKKAAAASVNVYDDEGAEFFPKIVSVQGGATGFSQVLDPHQMFTEDIKTNIPDVFKQFTLEDLDDLEPPVQSEGEYAALAEGRVWPLRGLVEDNVKNMKEDAYQDLSYAFAP